MPLAVVLSRRPPALTTSTPRAAKKWPQGAAEARRVAGIRDRGGWRRSGWPLPTGTWGRLAA